MYILEGVPYLCVILTIPTTVLNAYGTLEFGRTFLYEVHVLLAYYINKNIIYLSILHTYIR